MIDQSKENDLSTQLKFYKKQEEVFRKLVESTTDIILAQHLPDGTILYISPAIKPLLGYHPDTLNDKSIFDIIYPEDQEAVLERMHNSIDQKVESIKCRINDSGGTTVNCKIHFNTCRDDNQELQFIQSSITLIDESDYPGSEFEDFFTRVDIGQALVDENLQFYRVNRFLTKISGFGAEELRSKRLTSMLTTESKRKADLILSKVRKGEQVRDKVQILTKSGTPYWVELTITPVNIEQGVVKVLGLSFHDINQQQEEEKNLEIMERHYRLIAENVTDVISIHNLGGFYRYVSPSLGSVFGYEAEEVMGKVHYEFIHPNEQDIFKQIHYQLLFPGVHQVIEYRFRKKNGNYVWVETSAKSIGNGIYEPFEIICVTREITDRKLAEKFLQEKEATARALLNAPVDEIAVFDEDGLLIDCNETFLKNQDSNRSEIIGRTDMQVYGLKQPIRKVIETKTSIQYEQVRGGKYYENNSFPIIENQRVVKVAIFSRDITERRESEEHLKLKEQKLKRQNQELKRVNEELDNFAYRTSHDLRAPLSSVLGLLDLFELSSSPEEELKYLSLVRRSVQKLDNFVQDILNFSRNSRLDLQVESIDLSMAEKICQDLIVDHPNINAQINIKQDCLFYSDRFRLEFIFNNLLSNSIRYANPSASEQIIEVQIIVDEKKARILIKDNGIGIAAEHLPNVFQMFYRATAHNSGSGLGLYIVKQAVDKLNGQVNLKSTVGIGTEIEIVIPNLMLGGRERI